MPLINAARDMVRAEGYFVVGADMEAMRTLQTDEGFRAQALARAISDISDPKTPEQGSSLTNKWVDAAEYRGKRQEAETDAKAQGEVES